MAEEAIKVTVAATITVSRSAYYKNVHVLLSTALLGGVQIYSFLISK